MSSLQMAVLGLMRRTLSDETRTRLKSWLLPDESVGRFAHDGPRPADAPAPTALEEIFWAHEGNPTDKWHHYLPVYDRYLAPYRGTGVRYLEIGVSSGGSLQVMRRYLGEDAVIFGIDIDERCRTLDGQGGRVRIGSQADPAFLEAVVEEMGGVDVVVDDGSHISEHIRASFDVLFPRLPAGGLYIAEDLHCCYFRGHLAGYRSPRSFIEHAKSIVDDMHVPYHGRGVRVPAAEGQVPAVHFYDSMVVIEKRPVPPPRHTVRGGGGVVFHKTDPRLSPVEDA
ncbi:MAG: class I SAM-dependent methyltransferase [Pseudomonadota bacterium]